MKTFRCHECGKKFAVGTRPDGLPNGMGFQLKDGSTLNVCTDCIIKEGVKHDKSERRFNRLY